MISIRGRRSLVGRALGMAYALVGVLHSIKVASVATCIRQTTTTPLQSPPLRPLLYTHQHAEVSLMIVELPFPVNNRHGFGPLLPRLEGQGERQRSRRMSLDTDIFRPFLLETIGAISLCPLLKNSPFSFPKPKKSLPPFLHVSPMREST